MLLARPARNVWALDVGVPTHREPLIERAFARAPRLRPRCAICMRASPANPVATLSADELAPNCGTPPCSRISRANSRSRGRLRQGARAATVVRAGAASVRRGGRGAQVMREARRGLRRRAGGRAGIRRGAARRSRAGAGQRDPDARAGTVARKVLRVRRTTSRCCACWSRAHSRCAMALRRKRRYDTLLLLAPADADAHFNHGVALQCMGDAQGAARAYQRALTFRPGLVAADFNLGVLFQRARQPPGGDRRLLERAGGRPRARRRVQEPGRRAPGRRPDRCMACELPRLREALPDGAAARGLRARGLPARGRLRRACERYLDGLRREDFQARDEEELVDCLE